MGGEQDKKPSIWDQIVNDKEGGIGVNILQHWSKSLLLKGLWSFCRQGCAI